jgi:hypothetical protein
MIFKCSTNYQCRFYLDSKKFKKYTILKLNSFILGLKVQILILYILRDNIILNNLVIGNGDKNRENMCSSNNVS